jgi:hypothetical protein
MLQQLERFDAGLDVVEMREREKLAYVRDEFWLFRCCMHHLDLIDAWFPRRLSYQLQEFLGERASINLQLENEAFYPVRGISDGVATLTFNRPDRLNALSTPTMEGLLEALPRLARDAAVGVIVPAWWGRE